MIEKSWHRVAPGEDLVVDRFLATMIRRLRHQLDAANVWHRSGRLYAFDPPLPSPRAAEVFALTAIELGRAEQPRLPWVAIILFTVPNAVFIASTLIDLSGYLRS